MLCTLALLMLTVTTAITGRLTLLMLLDFSAVEFLLCTGLYLDTSPVIPVYIAMLVGIRSSGFSLINLTIKHDSCRRYLAILYHIVFWVLLICVFNKDMVGTGFVLFSIIVYIASIFTGVNLFHIVALISLLDNYFYEFEIPSLVSFVYTCWGFVSRLQYQLFFCINYAVIMCYFIHVCLTICFYNSSFLMVN